MTTLSTTTGLEVPLWLEVSVAALIGLFVGSFLNVVVYRVPRHLSISKPRSFCPTCQRQLSWWENVPLMSWVALGGHCRICKESISIRYPVVEASTAVSFALVTMAWSGSAEAIAYCLLASTLIAIVIIDIGTLRAPLAIAGIGTTLGDLALVAATIWTHHWTILVGAQIGLAIGCFAFAILRSSDPECLRSGGFGRTALLPGCCWLGGLWAFGSLVGLVAAVGSLGISIAIRRWMHEPVDQSGGTGLATGAWRRINRFLRLPLVLSVVVGVTVGLVAYA